MKFSIKSKLFVFFALSILVPIILICVFSGIQIRNSAIDVYYSDTEKGIGYIEKSIEFLLKDALVTASIYADSSIVKKVDENMTYYYDKEEAVTAEFLGQSDTEKEIVRFLRSLPQNNPAYLSAYVGTKWGNFITSSTKAYKMYDPRKRPWYGAALKNPDRASLSSAYLFSSGPTGITIMKPVKDSAGVIKGVVGLDMSLAELTDTIKKVKMGKKGFLMIVQKDGTILANPNDSKTNFKKLADTGVPAFKMLDDKDSGNLEVNIKGKKYLTVIRTMPEFGWKLIGFAEKSEVMGSVYKMLISTVFIGILVFAGFMVLAFFFARSISVPLKNATNMLKDIAEGEGDLTKELIIDSNDEIGEMAKSFNTFLKKLKNIIKEIVFTAGKVNESSDKLLNIAGSMKTMTEETAEKANHVSGATSEVNKGFLSVASSMGEATENTNMVAVSAEEMSGTIKEIAKNAEKARNISSRAVTDATEANKSMTELGISATEISNVTSAIAEISEQTNLLALNATIEAARAGEAGKGFSVVANEIKELANQTANATNDIKKQIEGIQNRTSSTITQIDSVTTVIKDINDIISSIATAIEQQSAATQEIAKNVSQASSGLNEVNENVSFSSKVVNDITKDISEVNEVAAELKENSNLVTINSEDLRSLAGSLQKLLGQFKID